MRQLLRVHFPVTGSRKMEVNAQFFAVWCRAPGLRAGREATRLDRATALSTRSFVQIRPIRTLRVVVARPVLLTCAAAQTPQVPPLPRQTVRSQNLIGTHPVPRNSDFPSEISLSSAGKVRMNSTDCECAPSDAFPAWTFSTAARYQLGVSGGRCSRVPGRERLMSGGGCYALSGDGLWGGAAHGAGPRLESWRA